MGRAVALILSCASQDLRFVPPPPFGAVTANPWDFLAMVTLHRKGPVTEADFPQGFPGDRYDHPRSYR